MLKLPEGLISDTISAQISTISGVRIGRGL